MEIRANQPGHEPAAIVQSCQRVGISASVTTAGSQRRAIPVAPKPNCRFINLPADLRGGASRQTSIQRRPISQAIAQSAAVIVNSCSSVANTPASILPPPTTTPRTYPSVTDNLATSPPEKAYPAEFSRTAKPTRAAITRTSGTR